MTSKCLTNIIFHMINILVLTTKAENYKKKNNLQIIVNKFPLCIILVLVFAPIQNT